MQVICVNASVDKLDACGTHAQDLHMLADLAELLPAVTMHSHDRDAASRDQSNAGKSPPSS